MQANEARVQKLIEGQLQYVVPLFQRAYSWKEKQWQTLWDDILELCLEVQPRNHFIGSIVTIPAKSVPEGVAKYVLIDGQQRLTTLFILLSAIRDRNADGSEKLSEKINNILLRNLYQDGNDVYKLLPTQVDRAAFVGIVDRSLFESDSLIGESYRYFKKALQKHPQVPSERVYDVIRNQLVVVSIVLESSDNPYVIFESLNAKGRPLTQADLIRNYFFMRFPVGQQEEVYCAHWEPMQDRLKDDLTEFIRHYLIRGGKQVKQSDVFVALKDRVDGLNQTDLRDYLRSLDTHSVHYSKFLDPTNEPSRNIRSRLKRLRQYEATTSFPFLLDAYHDYYTGSISAEDMIEVLDVLESFIIRRFICGVPTHGLNKVFLALHAQASKYPDFVDGLHAVLADKSFPEDEQFRGSFTTAPIYGGDRNAKAKLILERLEEWYAHKEAVDTAATTIEHVMPRTVTTWWKEHLGDNWQSVHNKWLDTVGNLTLTGYNSELSNADFETKKAMLQKSHLELNRYFEEQGVWDEQAIMCRGLVLADFALKIWPDIARDVPNGDEENNEVSKEEAAKMIAAVESAFAGVKSKLSKGTRYIVQMNDGSVLNIKYSKSHNDYYWFGYQSSLLNDAKKLGVTHVVFILAPHGYVNVPFHMIEQYLTQAGSSPKRDGSVRHYHVLITAKLAPELFHHGKPERVTLAEHYVRFL